MWVSPKKYILNEKGVAVEAGPGVSGTVLVGAGAEIPEEEARRYGLLKDGKEPSTQPADKKPPVVRDDNPLPKELNFGNVNTVPEPEPTKPWDQKKEDKTALSTE